MDWRGDNQRAQEEGDTSANEMRRIRAREAAVRQAWREFNYTHEALPTASHVSERASVIAGEFLGIAYCRAVAERNGMAFAPEGPPARIVDLDVGAPEPFCACGHRFSLCDGSRVGCGKGAEVDPDVINWLTDLAKTHP